MPDFAQLVRITMARYNVREGWMSEGLKREREASSLNLEELTNFLDGNEAMTERRRKICEEEEVELNESLSS